MIIEFSVKNFKSIRGHETFSMLANRKIKENKESLLSINKYNLLSVSLIYGRNASGKSNLIKAFFALQDMILDLSKIKVKDKIKHYQPYKLDKHSFNQPVEFKIDFIAKDKVRYIYEVKFNETKILKEVLFFYPKKQPAKLFERKAGKEIIYGDYLKGRKKTIEDSLYENQLFLSKVSVEKIEKIVPAFLFFKEYMFIPQFPDDKFDEVLIRYYSSKIIKNKNPSFSENINKLLRAADTGIQSISIKEIEFDSSFLPKEMEEKRKKEIIEEYKYQFRTVRNVYKADKKVGETDFTLNDESTGTLKLLGIGGLILDALYIGQVLIIDELDKSLHPKLTTALIQIFMNKKTNPNGAQLIFATHDVSLLDNSHFRRDQIWFAEKDYIGASTFYSIADIPGIRKNVPRERWYMNGRFGGTPIINQNELEFNIDKWDIGEKKENK